MKVRTACEVALKLGVLSLVAIVLAALALTDIRHGEADVTLEWHFLQVSFAIIIAFHIAGLLALRQALRNLGPGQ